MSDDPDRDDPTSPNYRVSLLAGEIREEHMEAMIASTDYRSGVRLEDLPEVIAEPLRRSQIAYLSRCNRY